MQTKPCSQCRSLVFPFGPVSPSEQSSFEEQPAVQRGPVFATFPVSPAGKMQMRLGHSRAGDEMIAVDPPLDPPSTACVPSSQIRPTCLSSQAPPRLSVASANSSRPRAAGEREAKEIEGRGEGNLMGTPWRPLGISRELRPEEKRRRPTGDGQSAK